MARHFAPDQSIIAPVLDQVQRFLTEHEERFFTDQTRRLAQENNKLRYRKALPRATGFVFEGVSYILPEHNFSSLLPGLEEDLVDEMKVLLASREDTGKEIKQISQLMFLMAKDHVETTQDLRDLLPECLIPAFPSLTQLDRTREPAFSIQDSPKMLDRWEKALPRIEYFTATRMLY
jgi:hypothetical protein